MAARFGVEGQTLPLPKSRGMRVVKQYGRQRRQQLVLRQQLREPQFGRERFKRCERYSVVNAQSTRARSTQRAQVRSASKRSSYVFRQYSHIGALAAINLNHELVIVVLDQRQSMHRNL